MSQVLRTGAVTITASGIKSTPAMRQRLKRLDWEMKNQRLVSRASQLKASLRPWSPPVQRRSMIGRWLRRMDRKRRYRLAQLRLTHHLDLTQDRFHPDGRLHRLEHERRRAWLHEFGELPPIILY